ncbi:exported hypothetical protein [Candidatus Sulfopaludibacter sp. SbA3]|nr:exported hypothetical protein [Candidatus Sulfopaludibacter sp. SbA3]
MKRNRETGLLVLGATAGALFFAPLLSGDDDLNFHAGAVTVQDIDSFLGTKQYKGVISPMVGTGSAFFNIGQTYNIDPALVVAISGIETDFGLRTCTTDNAWNWFWQGPCPNSPFTSYSDGIETVSKYLKLSYINKGYNTIALIQKRYCTAPVQNGVTCPGWISTVTLFRDQLLGLSPNPNPPPTTATSPPASSVDSTTTSETASSGGKYWWIAGAGALIALGWLLGRKRRAR